VLEAPSKTNPIFLPVYLIISFMTRTLGPFAGIAMEFANYRRKA
jgi:hypothetical protein